ncbi:39S ribosomal protein L36, mitochondrial isoform X1 [Tympanuchus pallidicinctus]|uniref:39S ribosomal protein L36, mitochondrial isoform X1 n=1 Tax=Tympanuchus pallidicinctus TaxID=109042 RepID=UPI002286F26A|nr:39S ribosomal protein L36, mitochondrial isoform X1 [Tympanuchus pallidicinctus]
MLAAHAGRSPRPDGKRSACRSLGRRGRARIMLSFLARVTVGPLRSLGRSPLCSLAPRWRMAAIPVPLCSGETARRRVLLAGPPLPGLLQLCAGLKTKTSIKRRCKDCYIVRRRGRLYVCCKTNPRHKQRKL